METCYVDQQSYVDCELDGSGTTATADDSSFEVVAKSPSGVTFKIAKDTSGASSRT
jgi:hypothetical protein